MLYLLIIGLLLTVFTPGVESAGQAYFTYEDMVERIQSLAHQYPDLISIRESGQSVEGRTIWSVSMGHGPSNVLITGALHASEWISTPVLLETMEAFAREHNSGRWVGDQPLDRLLEQYTLTFFPMANPDGVTLVQQGVEAFPEREEELLNINPDEDNFDQWKANIKGVDLNRNFSSRWGEPISGEENDEPSYAFYGGPDPVSEPETQAIVNWVQSNDPVLLLDYHSYGDYLFWYYKQSGATLERDRALVQAMRSYSGYRKEPISLAAMPSATLTNWGSQDLGIPSVCVELGSRPPRYLTMANVAGIFSQVKYLPFIAISNLPSYDPYIAVQSVSLPRAIGIEIEDTETLTAQVAPAAAFNKDISWSSSNSDIVSVEDGKLTAKQLGTATITATSTERGLSASSAVTVRPTKYMEAAQISREGWDKSSAVIVTTVDGFGTAGQQWARQLEAPVLVSAADTLTEHTQQEVQRLEPERAYIFAQNGTISPEVEQELHDVGADVVRVKGHHNFPDIRSQSLPLINEPMGMVSAFELSDILSLVRSSSDLYIIEAGAQRDVERVAEIVLTRMGVNQTVGIKESSEGITQFINVGTSPVKNSLPTPEPPTEEEVEEAMATGHNLERINGDIVEAGVHLPSTPRSDRYIYLFTLTGDDVLVLP